MKNEILPSWVQLFDKLNITSIIEEKLTQAYQTPDTLPARRDALRLFSLCPVEKVRVVIVGQDPYHTPGMADGIAFSTRNTKTPPSLKNIFTELKSDTGIMRTKNDLSDWVVQGVLLINTAWTVKAGVPASHSTLDWPAVVIPILRELAKHNDRLIFCLWGNHAKTLYNKLEVKAKFLITSSHPSPFSYRAGFVGSKPFSKINEIIVKYKLGEVIKW